MKSNYLASFVYIISLVFILFIASIIEVIDGVANFIPKHLMLNRYKHLALDTDSIQRLKCINSVDAYADYLDSQLSYGFNKRYALSSRDLVVLSSTLNNLFPDDGRSIDNLIIRERSYRR